MHTRHDELRHRARLLSSGFPFDGDMTSKEHWAAKLRKLNPNVSKTRGNGRARFAPPVSHAPGVLGSEIEDVRRQAALRQPDRGIDFRP